MTLIYLIILYSRGIINQFKLEFFLKDVHWFDQSMLFL